MTKTLIRQIKTIRNYRIFQNWKPDGGVEFARVNLIYGQNGSGKSTFASLLSGCAANATTESEPQSDSNDATSSGLQLLAARDAETSSYKINVNDLKFWSQVRVFNKDFVHRNLRFEEADGPHPEALLTIGERLADAEKNLRVLRSKRDELNNSIHMLDENISSANTSIDRQLAAVAKHIVDDLRSSPFSRYRATNVYTKRQVRELLENNSSLLADASTDLAADRKRATGKAMKPVDLPPRGSLLEQDALNDVRQLLATSVLGNTPISELVGHSDRSKWVQEGISLHQNLEECLFCGQALPADRIEALNAHFDESFKKLQAGIDSFINHLKQSEAASKSYLNSFPALSDVYEDLQEELQKFHATYESDHKTYAETIYSIVLALKEKRENPFGTPKLSSNLTLTAPTIDGIKSVVDKHQEKINLHDTEAEKAAQRVEYFHIANFLDEYVKFTNDLEALKKEQNSQKTNLEDLDRKIAILESVDGDPAPGANELTNGLCGLLGRNELTFSTQDSKHYVIKRAGAPATHLSEGEQTAIALLYFLSSVREDKIAGDPPIIVIDDPVSSLDNEILFGVSAHIWSELVVNDYVSQLFLMTHSFEFFRQWLIQLESRQQHEDCDYAAYQMTPTYAQRGPDEFRRTPRLSRWETDKNRTKVLRSEYHFLFSKVAHAVADRQKNETQADQMMELALIPNAARRMLEGFLSFRCPGKMGSFHVALEEVMNGAKNLDSSVRTRVEKYLHTYSHFDGGNISQPLRLNEVTTVLRSLFQLMDHVDHDHVSSMCRALDIEEHRLLGNLTTASYEGH